MEIIENESTFLLNKLLTFSAGEAELMQFLHTSQPQTTPVPQARPSSTPAPTAPTASISTTSTITTPTPASIPATTVPQTQTSTQVAQQPVASPASTQLPSQASLQPSFQMPSFQNLGQQQQPGLNVDFLQNLLNQFGAASRIF
jgi:hypothetical protein